MNASFLCATLFMLAATGLHAAVIEKPIEYKAGDVTAEGWHVYDDAKEGKRPAMLIIHQWTGISDHEKERARRLAGLGYNVLVADVYGKGVRPQPPEAGKEAGKYKNNRQLLRQRLTAGLDTLLADPRTDPAHVAAMGFCFGGTAALELARGGANLKGVISFHGGLDSPNPEDGKNIKGQVLALHGADDPFVPAKDIVAFEEEMKKAGVEYKLVKYPGAVHSFTQRSAGNDNSKGAAYNEAADKASWQEMKQFLSRVVEQKPRKGTSKTD